MKLDFENTVKIKEWFNSNSIPVDCSDDVVFSLYKDIQYYGSIVNNKSVTERVNVIKKQIDFIRKSIVNILYEENGKQAKGLKCGYVYAISNPAWPDYIKIGSAVDVYDRLSSYQTSSPLRDYEIVSYVYSKDRLLLESSIHDMFERNNEWVLCSKTDARKLLRSFNSYPEKAILEFSIIETLKVFCRVLPGSPREVVQRSLKNCQIKISEYTGIDYNTLDCEIRKSKNYAGHKRSISFIPLGLNFNFSDSEVTINSVV